MIDFARYLTELFAELERLVPSQGTRHMISTTEEGRFEIRIGAGDWYRVSKGAINLAGPLEAARSVAKAPSYKAGDLG
jgi:hypothetical protein